MFDKGFVETFKHAREFLRAIVNHKYEVSDDGIFMPAQKILLSGRYDHESPDGKGLITDYNLLPTEGLNHIWTATVANGTQVTTWYTAIHSGTGTPASTWTAANYASNATELTTAYSEATRVEYEEGTPASGSVDNSANKATFTAASTSVTVWGAALLSLSTKGGMTGTLLSVSKFASSRSLPAIGDELNITITLSATSS